MKSYDYTISSTDYEHNNRIITNLSNPQTEYCKMTITSLTTMANFIVLNKSDYFILNGVKYDIDDDYSDVSTSSLTEYLNTLLQNHNVNDIEFYYDSCSRIYITSTQSLTLTDCSYNLKLLLGIVNVTLPINSERIVRDSNTVFKMLFPDVGMFLSTPVLYLASNLGSNSYKNVNKSFTSMRILMRINNSFFAKQPIINPNGDYTTTVKCSDLSDARFTLVDANYHEVKLLSPMYLTVQIESIPDKNIVEQDFSNGAIDPSTLIPMNDFAYMVDNTERGVDVNLDDVDKMIYINTPTTQQQTVLMDTSKDVNKLDTANE